MLTSAATLLVLGAATSLLAVAVAAFGYGLCLDLFRPAVQAAIADLVPDAERPRAFALQFWAVNLGFSIGTPLGGFLASRGYWLLFVLDAAASVAFAGLILRGVPETRPVQHVGAPGRLREVLSDRLMVALVVSVVAASVVYLQAFSTLPLVFERDGLGPGSYGLAIGLNGVLIVLLQPLLLGTLGRRRRGPLLLGAMLLQGAGFGLTAFADAMPMHLVAITVWTLGEVLQAGLLGALVASLAPVHLRGRLHGHVRLLVRRCRLPRAGAGDAGARPRRRGRPVGRRLPALRRRRRRPAAGLGGRAAPSGAAGQLVGSAASMASRSVASSGSTSGRKRPTTSPSGDSSQHFSKFHCTSPAVALRHGHGGQLLEQRPSGRPVDVGLREQRERDAVGRGAELRDLLGAAGSLPLELVARDADDREALGPRGPRASPPAPAYCGVRPHFEATLTISAALPLASAPAWSALRTGSRRRGHAGSRRAPSSRG
jgi:predicted MFS family arabinose efflux permease